MFAKQMMNLLSYWNKLFSLYYFMQIHIFLFNVEYLLIITQREALILLIMVFFVVFICNNAVSIHTVVQLKPFMLTVITAFNCKGKFYLIYIEKLDTTIREQCYLLSRTTKHTLVWHKQKVYTLFKRTFFQKSSPVYVVIFSGTHFI